MSDIYRQLNCWTWVEKLGLSCMFLFFLFGMTNYELAYKFLNVSCVLGVIYFLKIKKVPWLIFGWWGVGLLIQAAGWLSVKLDENIWSTPYPDFDFLTKFFFFIMPLSFFIERKNIIPIFWGVSLLGLGWIVLPSPKGLLYWQDAINGGRSSFGTRNVQDLALFFAVSFLGLTCLFKRWWNAGITFRALGIFFLILSFVGIILCQTRGIWLALVIAFVSIALIFIFRSGIRGQSLLKILTASMVFAFTTYFSGLGTLLMHRVSAESDVIWNIATFNWSNIPMTSAGIRFHLWNTAYEQFLQRPWFGWNNHEISRLIIHKYIPQVLQYSDYSHFHSILFEILVRCGIIGLLFIFGFFIYTWRICHKAWIEGKLPADIYVFGLGFVTLFSICNFFEPYMKYYSGRFLLIAVLLGLLSYCFSEAGER